MACDPKIIKCFEKENNGSVMKPYVQNGELSKLTHRQTLTDLQKAYYFYFMKTFKKGMTNLKVGYIKKNIGLSPIPQNIGCSLLSNSMSKMPKSIYPNTLGIGQLSWKWTHFGLLDILCIEHWIFEPSKIPVGDLFNIKLSSEQRRGEVGIGSRVECQCDVWCAADHKIAVLGIEYLAQ